MKALFRAVHNYFRMLRKDSGAHFTYNLGVGLVRTSLLLLLWGLLIFAEWFVFANPSFHSEGEVRIKVLEAKAMDDPDDKLGRGSYARMLVTRSDRSSFEHLQYISYSAAEGFNNNRYVDDTVTYRLYSMTGTGRRMGEHYGYYVSAQRGIGLQWEYFLYTAGAHSPVQTWAIWLAFIVSLILFLMGRRQIRLAMKYPRSDVPTELSGAPEVLYNDDYFRGGAEGAVREDMREAAETRLLEEHDTEKDDAE